MEYIVTEVSAGHVLYHFRTHDRAEAMQRFDEWSDDAQFHNHTVQLITIPREAY